MIALKPRVDTLFLPEYGYYEAYGVDVYDKENIELILSVQDISLEEKKINEFVALCNSGDVDRIHFYDIMEDFFFSR